MTLRDDHVEYIARQLGVEKAEELKRRRELRENLWKFVLWAWPLVDPAIFKANWHHELICHHLQRVSEGLETRLLINVPPGAAKSSLVNVMWPAWNWLMRPTFSTIHTSYDMDLLLRDAEKTQTIIQSAEYQGIVPTLFGKQKNEKWALDGGRSALSYYQTSERGFRFSATVAGANTGHRANAIVCDDPQNVKKAKSDLERQGVKEWWDKAMSSRVSDPAKSAFVIIMQRLHEDDLAGHLLAKDEKHKDDPLWIPYTHVCLPTRYDPEKHCPGDPRTVKGELLHPEMWGERVDLMAQSDEGLGPYDYSAQHDQNPTPAGSGIFDMSKIVFWWDGDKEPEPHKEPSSEIANSQVYLGKDIKFGKCIQSWDLTFKETLNSDYVCGQLWYTSGAKCFLMDQVHGKMAFTKTVEIFKAKYTDPKWRRAFGKYVEDKANGPAVINTLENTVPGLIAVNPEGGKQARANAISPLIAAGNVVLPHPRQHAWVASLLKEMRGFPKAKHDDQVDALTQALNQLYGKGFNVIKTLAMGASRYGFGLDSTSGPPRR